jgi:ribosomal protein S12 methylthiotransferase
MSRSSLKGMGVRYLSNWGALSSSWLEQDLLRRKAPTTGSSVRYWSSRVRNARQRRRPSTARFQEEPKKIMFQSLGCPRNFVDTEVMLGLCVQSGIEITQDVAEADYLVVNTCGFLESARQESREAIDELAQGKKANSKLLVTGCMVNLHKEQILEDFPAVDSILGSGAIDKILETIEKLEEDSETRLVQSANRRSFLERGDTPRFLATPPHYAYLKIAEGCKKRCAFCIIPQIKGRLQSKPILQLVEEFQGILEHGASEIILIAQDLGDYGKDFKSSSSPTNLEQLLRALLDSTEDPNLWLRLLYLYPDEITPGLIDLIEEDPRICRYLDMPIQHSHDDMLASMRRKTTGKEIKATIETLRGRIPGIHIRTSLMVGFPGETEEHFQHLLDFVQEYELDNVGVFTYSDEAMAYSSRLPNHVPEKVKEERYHRLMQAQLETVLRKNQARVENKERMEVVIEGLQDENTIVGRYYGQCPDIDGQVLLDAKESVYGGARYWVEVTGFDEYDLIGRIVDGPTE